jgi:alcohol dehydrogenase
VFQTINFVTPSVIFGNDTVDQVGAEAKRLGARRVLLITGPSVQKTGVADRVIESLKAQSLDVVLEVLEKSTTEPTTELAENTAEQIKKLKADVVIGLGGGSIMDVAKMAAALPSNPGKVREFFGPGKVKNRGIPTIMLPTTSGTGAEVTKHAIFLDQENDVKKAVASINLLPNVAIVDPLLTVTCPAHVTASAGMDAYFHAAEPFVSNMANPITDSIALEAIKLVTKWLGPAFSDGTNVEARYNMSLGSLMAGFVLNNAGTSLVHAMAYPIGGEFHVPHGISLTVLVVACFDYIIIARQDKFVKLADAMGEVIEGLSSREAAKRSLEALRYLIKSVDLPASLTDLDITDHSKVDRWAKEAYAEQRLLGRSVRKLSVEDIKKIYLNAF